MLRGGVHEFSPLVSTHPPTHRTRVRLDLLYSLSGNPSGKFRTADGAERNIFACIPSTPLGGFAEFCCDVACGFTPSIGAIISTVVVARNLLGGAAL